MPRYFFHVRDRYSSEDATGTELASIREAHLEAIRLAGNVIAEHAVHVSKAEGWRLEVTDEARALLFRFDFLSGTSPSAQHLLAQTADL